MIPNVITTQAELETFVNKIFSSPWIAIDTEFMRESTYYPKLCLIQIATQEICVCIDVIALDNIDALINFIKQSAAIKIFHSARQDLEVLYCTYDFLPEPLFDSQIAASILGMDEQISYAELVSQELSITLPKSESRTNWSQRPLTEAQIKYALDDVLHLGPLALKLQQKLEAKQRWHWLTEECHRLLNPDNYSVAPEHAWKQVKGVGRLEGRSLYNVQQLATWREQTAITKNLPRRWIIKDQTMTDLAFNKTINENTVRDQLSQESPKSVRHTKKVLEILEHAAAQKINDLEGIMDRRLSKPQQALVKDMMKTIRKHAEEIGTSSSLLANRKSLVNLVLGLNSKVNEGWRHQEIGEQLSKMLNS
ncbi:MAG: ribonuclease D [Chloroflexota bacterium]